MNERQRYEKRVRALEAFGHRGSATNHERRAADYLIGELQGLGLEGAQEAFQGSQSWGGRYLLHVLTAAFGAMLLWRMPIATTLLGTVALGSLWAEQTTRCVGLSWPLVRARSVNVTACIRPTEPACRRLIVCGHYDTQRTGWIWSVVRRMIPVSSRLPVALMPPLLSLQLTLTAQILIGLCAIRWSGNGVLSLAGAMILIIYAIYALLFGNWFLGRSVPGAADNASGAAAVLTLAETWRDNPVPDTELVLLLSGCEETGLLGASAWLDRHRDEIRSLPTAFLNIDSVGFGPPRFLGWEVPALGWPRRYPPELVAAVGKVAAARNLTDTGPHALPGPTDGLAFLARGVFGITIVGFQEGKILPHYHEMQDRADAMDFDSAWAGVAFARAVMVCLTHDL